MPEDATQPSTADRRRLEDLHAGNARREQQLKAQGVGLDRTSIVAIQIQALKDVMLGDDEAALLEYEVAYQERLSEALATIEDQVARTKLATPSPLTLLRPNGHG